jgi:ATP phosphoribosyltransferase
MRIALPTGRLEDPAWAWLEGRGFMRSDPHGRRLWVQLDGLGVVMVRGRDIPNLLAQHVIDAAIVGRDVVEESGVPLWSGESLGFGTCRLMLAVPQGAEAGQGRLRRIATRYPRITRRWLSLRRMEAEVLTLAGAVEAAPWLGLADAIVDVVETGATLQANGLTPVETVLPCYAVLVTLSGREKIAQTLLGDLPEERREHDRVVGEA